MSDSNVRLALFDHIKLTAENDFFPDREAIVTEVSAKGSLRLAHKGSSDGYGQHYNKAPAHEFIAHDQEALLRQWQEADPVARREERSDEQFKIDERKRRIREGALEFLNRPRVYTEKGGKAAIITPDASYDLTKIAAYERARDVLSPAAAELGYMALKLHGQKEPQRGQHAENARRNCLVQAVQSLSGVLTTIGSDDKASALIPDRAEHDMLLAHVALRVFEYAGDAGIDLAGCLSDLIYLRAFGRAPLSSQR